MLKFKKITAILLAVALLLGAMPFALLASAEGTASADLEIIGSAKYCGNSIAANNGYWIFEKGDDGYYGIKEATSGGYLTIVDGALVIAVKKDGVAAQRWELVAQGGWYGTALSIKNVGTGKYLVTLSALGLADAQGDSTIIALWAEGTAPSHPNNGLLSGNAVFSADSIVEGTKYIIGHGQWNGHMLGAEITYEEEPIAYASFTNAPGDAATLQNYWRVEAAGDAYYVRNAATGYYLAVYDGKVALKAKADAACIWNFPAQASTFLLKNAKTGLYLLLAGGVSMVSHDDAQWHPCVFEDATGARYNSVDELAEGKSYLICNQPNSGHYLGVPASIVPETPVLPDVKEEEPDEPEVPEEPETIYEDTAFSNAASAFVQNGYWIFVDQGEGVVSIKNAATEKYLAVVDGATCLLDYNAADDRQLWAFGEYNSEVNLQNKATGQYLNASAAAGGATLENGGSAIGIWPEGTTPGWISNPAYTNNGLTGVAQMVYGDKYMIGNATWNGNFIGAKAVAVTPEEYFVLEHAGVAANAVNAIWKFEKVSDGIFYIKNVETGLYMVDVDGKLCQGSKINAANAMWNIFDKGEGVMIVNGFSGYGIDVATGTIKPMDDVQYSPIGLIRKENVGLWNADNAEVFDLTADISEDAEYYLCHRLYPDHFLAGSIPTLDLNGINPVDGAVNVVLGNAICFKASYAGLGATAEILSGEDNILVIANDDGSLYIEGKVIGEAKVLIASVENPSVKLELTINVTGEVGDVNSDGELDIRDLVGAKKYLVGLGNKSNFDINADGVSDLTDIVLLRKAVLGLGYQVNEATTFSLTAGRTYDNPYTEISVNALFEGPNGEKITVPAYWAGGTTFNVRFAPTSVGTWTYTTACTNAEDKGLHGKTGSFEVVKNVSGNELTKHGRLALSDSGEYLVHADGTPFFWLAETSWFAMGDRGDFETVFKPIVDQRSSEGYNVFQSILWVSNVMDQLQLGNEGGNQWNGAIWRDINPEYWDWVEKRVQYLVDNGMVPVLGFDWGGSLSADNLEDYKRVVRYAIARLSAYPVVWNLSGEYVHNGGQNTSAYKELYNQLGLYVDATDPYNNLTTVHDLPATSAEFIDGTWCDFVMNEGGHIQGRFDACGWDNVAAKADKAGKPWLEAEAKYENIAGNTPDETRMIAWLAVMNGSMGFSYGAEGLWELTQNENDWYQNPNGAWSKTPIPWYDAINCVGGTTWMPNMKNFFESTPWWSLEVNPSGITYSGVTAKDGIAKPVAKANADKSYTIVYLPMTSNSDFRSYTIGANASVTVSGLEAGAEYKAWFYQTKGTYKVDATATKNGTSMTVSFPADLAENDYMLVIEKVGADFGDGVESAKTLKVTGETEMPKSYTVPVNSTVITFDKAYGTQGVNGIYYAYFDPGFEEFTHIDAANTVTPYWGEYSWGSGIDAENWDIGTSEIIADNLLIAGENNDAVIYWQADKAGTVTIDSYLAWQELWPEPNNGYGANVQIIYRTAAEAEDNEGEFTVLADYNFRPDKPEISENAHFYDNIKVNEGDQIMIKVSQLDGFGHMENQVKPNTTLYFVAD